MDFKNIEILSHNSFFCGKLIAHFLSGCKSNEIRIELVFLLLPFVFNKDSREILKKVNSESTLNSAFLNNERGKIALAGLEKRLEFFKGLTQTSLVVASNEFTVKISEIISIENPLDYGKEKELYIKEYYRAANYFGRILSNNDFFDTFIKFGIKDIWTVTLNK